jgi:hypothetical protein
MMKNKRILSMLSLLVLGSLVFSLSAMAQSESDLVRAAKEKPAQKAKHVYTDSDFPERPQAASVEPATGTVVGDMGSAKAPDSGVAKASDAAAAPTDASKTADGNSDAKPDSKTDAKADAESKQAAKVADLKNKLAQTKRDEEELQQKLDTLDQKAKNEKDEFRKNMYLDAASNQQITLSDYRRKEEQLQKQIDDEGKKQEKTDNKEPQ